MGGPWAGHVEAGHDLQAAGRQAPTTHTNRHINLFPVEQHTREGGVRIATVLLLIRAWSCPPGTVSILVDTAGGCLPACLTWSPPHGWAASAKRVEVKQVRRAGGLRRHLSWCGASWCGALVRVQLRSAQQHSSQGGREGPTVQTVGKDQGGGTRGGGTLLTGVGLTGPASAKRPKGSVSGAAATGPRLCG